MDRIITSKRIGIAAAFCLAVGFASTATAQSAADPTGEPPIGIETKSDAKGPSLVGVLHVALLNSTGTRADAAEVTIRLRRGPLLQAFFQPLNGPIFFDTDAEKAQLQDDLLAAFRDEVLGFFYSDECGRLGDQCPNVDIVLKKAEEFQLASDIDNQYVLMDIVIATTSPL